MSRVHLVVLWHMHQPLYSDPATGRYVLPWTRLHALKDYWGMVKIMEEFPGVHATFNMVPSLAAQIQEYANGAARDPWVDLVFTPAELLTREEHREILDRAFQLNHENLMRRWPRFGELYDWVQSAGADAATFQFGNRDWRDLQLLSQLAWMDEEYLQHDPVVLELARKGSDFSEEDKRRLQAVQQELLSRILPEYQRAAERGQIEISTTPFYHPILPLLCDTDIARVSNPRTPLPQPAFRHPEDAREQLTRARVFHEQVFGQPPKGLWPSEGSVSAESMRIAAETGFEWFATDEGVLGPTRNVGFWRDGAGYPDNAQDLYSPWRVILGDREMGAVFRDHYLSDLIGFVYSRVDPEAAVQDLYRRLKLIGERAPAERPATVSLILDGENAWEYYRGNGREFLRRFYGRIQNDPEICALTVSEAIAADAQKGTLQGIFPASWINANFDVWIGHEEDVRAWDLLREARDVYARACGQAARQESGAPREDALRKAHESILAAEGSDWCWWYGPEHSTANDAEFDALFRKHLTGVYAALGLATPDVLAHAIKRIPEQVRHDPPASYLDVRVDGIESHYFEWQGAGTYSTDRRTGAMQGQDFLLGDVHYGFSKDWLYVRLDPLPGMAGELANAEIGITIWDDREHRIMLRLENGALAGYRVESAGCCLLHPVTHVLAAFQKIAEIQVSRELFQLWGRRSLLMSFVVWKGGLPVDTLPAQGYIEIRLGEENFAWPME